MQGSTGFWDPRQRTLAAGAVLLAATVGALLPLARPGPAEIGFGALLLLPLAALVIAGAARAATVAAALVYVAVLLWAYTAHIAPSHAYEGLIDVAPDPVDRIAAAAFAVVPATWMPLTARRPSTVLVWFLWLLGYVPSMIVPLFLRGSLEPLLPLDLTLVASMAVLGLILRLPPPRMTPRHLSLTAFTWLLAGLAVLSSLSILATFGLRALPSLSQVYDARAEFKTTTAASGPGIGYVVVWAGNVINPLLLALGLARRRFDLVGLGIAGLLLVYSVTGFRFTLFSVALVPLVYCGIARGGRSFGLLTVLAGPVVLFAAVAGKASSPETLGLASRTFATPGQLTYYYYEFFSSHPTYHLSHSFLGWLFTNPYGTDPPLVIGSTYFREGTNANANVWADGFANAGLPGMVAFTVVLGVVLWVMDGLGAGKDARVAGPMVALLGLALAGAALFTTLLTGGLLLGCVLIALMPPVLNGSSPPATDPMPHARRCRSPAPDDASRT